MSDSIEYHSPKVKMPKLPPTARAKRFFLIIYVLASLLLVIIASDFLWERRIDPMGGWGTVNSDIAFFFGSIGIFASMIILWLSRILIYDEPWPARLKYTIFFLVPIMTIAIAMLLEEREVPFRMAFSRSRLALENAVAEVRRDPSKAQKHQTWGVLPVESVKIDDGVARLSVKGAGFDVDHYLMWIPGGPSPKASRVESLGHDWYWVDGY